MRNLTHSYRIGLAALTSLFITNTSIAYSQEIETLPAFDNVTKNPVESHICDGLLNMLKQDPIAALNKLDQASFQRQQFNLGWDETDFFIAFCKVIACDRLGWQKESTNLQNILLSSLDDDSLDIPSQQVVITTEESLEAIGFLTSLASLAVSQEVQMILQSIVTQLAGELFPAFQFTSTTSLLNRNWQFETFKDAIMIQPCSTSKFIKRWKHILKKAWEILTLFRETKQFFEEAGNAINS